MRSFVSLFLVSLLLACPLLCRAIEPGCSHELTGGANDLDDDSHIPPSCPDDGVSCISGGAVQTGELRAVDLPSPMTMLFLDGWFPTSLLTPLISLSQHLTAEGTPTGLAALGDALSVRAFLQNFRF